MNKTKIENEPLPVYIVTKTGAGYNDEGVRAVADLVLEGDTSEAGPQGYGIGPGTTGILALSGPHLLDPGTLKKELEANPYARVVVATRNDGSFALCGYGPQPSGLPSMLELLDEAAEAGETTHKALVREIRPDLMEELYGEE